MFKSLNQGRPLGSHEKRILLASTSTTGLLAPDDLAETIEVQSTPEIRAKAQELGNNPVKIYEWVRNNIEFVPTWGSIQGAQMTLQTKQGNAFDTASLLIALLRAAGIHARYVTGTVELPIDKLMNWAGGFTSEQAALEFMASGGVPVKAGIASGKITKALFEHVWVEAWIDMVPSFGAVHKEGDTWIPLDAAFKQNVYTNGIDLKSAVPFDAQTLVDQLKSSATINESAGAVTRVDADLVQANLLNFQALLKEYIDKNRPNSTFGDIVGKKSIAVKKYSVLSESMPYKTVVKGGKFAEIPDSLRHKITFALRSQQLASDLDSESGSSSSTAPTVTKSLPEIGGKKITLSYAPAGSFDTQQLLSYVGSGQSPLPAYLIKVKPELRIGGQVVATGDSITLGQMQQFDMTMTAPTLDMNIISNNLTAGAFSAIVLDVGTIAAAQLDESAARASAAKAKLEADNIEGITKDDIMGEFLHGTGLGYWGMADFANRIASSVNGVVDSRLPSEGMFTYDLSTVYFFGIPRWVTPTGFTTDIDADNHVTFGRNGDNASSVSYMAQIGMLASKMEAGIYDLTFNKAFTGRGVSTAHILEYANQQGIPIYTVNASNINAVLPQLQIDSEVKTDIQNAVASGKIVTVPKTNISKDSWRGTGYLVFDSATGAGAYRISEGLSGGGYSCQCWQMPPVAEFIVSALLIGAGVAIAGGIGVVVAIAIVGVFISTVSLLSSLCQISNSPDLHDAADRELLESFVIDLYIASLVLTLIGFAFGGFLGFVAFSLVFAVLSIIASNTVTSWGPLFARLRQQTQQLP